MGMVWDPYMERCFKFTCPSCDTEQTVEEDLIPSYRQVSCEGCGDTIQMPSEFDSITLPLSLCDGWTNPDGSFADHQPHVFTTTETHGEHRRITKGGTMHYCQGKEY